MTNEEAIRYIYQIADETQEKLDRKRPLGSLYAQKILMALSMAIAALRKQQERENPRTKADRIRNATDEELADMITQLMSRQRSSIIGQLQAAGVAVRINVIEMPMLTKAAHLEWLREPAENESSERG